MSLSFLQNYRMTNFLVLFCFICFLSIDLVAQKVAEIPTKKIVNTDIYELKASRFRLGLGFTTQKIQSSNVNAKQIVNPDSNVTAIGGSFRGAQPGFELRGTYFIDEDAHFIIPFGFEYSFYTARERIPITRFILHVHENQTQILSPYVGFHTTITKIPLGKAILYGGGEIRMNYIMNNFYTLNETYINLPEASSKTNVEKDDAIRYGANLRIGVIGTLVDNIQVNISGGLGFMNLFGSDDARGELLTPRNILETGESSVMNYNFSILVQYSL